MEATPPGSGRSPVSSSRATYFSPRDDRFASSRQEAPRSSRTTSSDEQWGTPRQHGGTPRMTQGMLQHQASFSSNDDYLSATSRSATSRSAEYSFTDAPSARSYYPPAAYPQQQQAYAQQQRPFNNNNTNPMLQQPSTLLSNRSMSSSDNFATTRSWESAPQSPHYPPPRPTMYGPPEDKYGGGVGGGSFDSKQTSPYASSFAPRPGSAAAAASPKYGAGGLGVPARADAKWTPGGADDYKGYYPGDLNAIGEVGGVASAPATAGDGLGPGLSEADVLDIFSFARHGRVEEIERLLNRGVPVDVRDEFGNTLLIIACQQGNKRVAKSVLRRGANINARNTKGNTPLHYCFHFGYVSGSVLPCCFVSRRSSPPCAVWSVQGDSLGQYLISKGL